MPVRRYLVSGRVQGVFFRASTQQRARELGINGHALNLADGRVEVLAQADEATLAQLESWLWRGPPQARVDSVAAEDSGESVPVGFGTG
ncbi:MAG: acylphosphatase [Lysobacterales bacterium]